MDITEISIIHHVGIVLIALWILSSFSCCHPFAYLTSLIYLYLVHEHYILRLTKKLHYDERKQANQRRLLSDSETVRWLNHAVEKVWPICMERIASQQILLPIIPWFLEKYKPWTAKKAVAQHLYLGRNPPVFTEIRAITQSPDDDHLVLELGMNFLTADDMSAILAVKLRRRLGFGMWAKLHVTGMHIEGKVLVGVKFLREWPFLGRLRICFVEPPYFQMTVKPIVSHGLNVTEIPGIAGWLDKLLAVAFEQTLVEPNMLVVDMEKFVSPSAENWFTVDEKDPIAYVKVEVIEAAEMKPSDPNGLADPYVKGQLGPYRFRTKTQKKTLTPKWLEEFKIPICTWESSNVLALEVCDKDHFLDDTLGDCSLNINDLRNRQRHDMWISLQNIKVGRLHVAVTVLDVIEKGGEDLIDPELFSKKESANTIAKETVQKVPDATIPSKKDPHVTDVLEPINVEGQEQTGIWVHHPGNDVSQKWEPRKRGSRQADIQIHNVSVDSPSTASVSNPIGNSSSDEDGAGHKLKQPGRVRRSLRKFGSVFHRSPKEEPYSTGEAVLSLPINIRAVSDKGTNLKVVLDDEVCQTIRASKENQDITNSEKNEAASPNKGHMKDMARSLLKHAEHGFKHVSRKLSNKSKGDSGSASTEVENDHGYDLSDYETTPSPSMRYKSTAESIPVCLDPVKVHGVEAPDPKDQTVQVSVSDSPLSISETTVGNASFQSADKEIKNSSDPHHGLVEKFSDNKKTSKEIME